MIPVGFRDVWDDQSVGWAQGMHRVPEPGPSQGTRTGV